MTLSSFEGLDKVGTTLNTPMAHSISKILNIVSQNLPLYDLTNISTHFLPLSFSFSLSFLSYSFFSFSIFYFLAFSLSFLRFLRTYAYFPDHAFSEIHFAFPIFFFHLAQYQKMHLLSDSVHRHCPDVRKACVSFSSLFRTGTPRMVHATARNRSRLARGDLLSLLIRLTVRVSRTVVSASRLA